MMLSEEDKKLLLFGVAVIITVTFVITVITLIVKAVHKKKYKELETKVLKKLNFSNWDIVYYYDEYVTVKSRQALNKYDDVKFFKENKGKLARAKSIIKRKNEVVNILKAFLNDNEFKTQSQYSKLSNKVNEVIRKASGYRICVKYITHKGNYLSKKTITLSQKGINRFEKDPSLLMTKGEYNKYLKDQQKEELNQKQHKYYEIVNTVIDYANENRDILFIRGSIEQLDNLIAQLFDRIVNSIKKIKTIDSEEWNIIGNFIIHIDEEIRKIVSKNHKILEYYASDDFLKIKETCEVLMSTQREFNGYIIDKVAAISQLFGTRVIRNETINEDEYQYIRPYKKTITAFTAEVSSSVFASAENNPLDYVIKNFYPNKEIYPEQIQKLHLLIEELATLKEARKIIENYKVEYKQYLGDVPDFIMKDDEAGFYSRLGFANIDESVLVVEYKFSYTSGGGFAKRTFTVPMTEETIVELIKGLEAKLTASAFTKEQRALMTNKLRESVKVRDNFTCRNCGNSIHKEPNLLLEIDHILPVSKGGYTVEDNLQTLCWKCNRAKSNKVLD
jgi:rubrerythrin